MRRLFTTSEARSCGLTKSALQWGRASGRWRGVVRGVYAEGPDGPTELDVARARVLAGGGVAAGRLAGVLHGLDSVTLGASPARQRLPPPATVVLGGVPCTDGLRTLVDLAAVLDDDVWEQALECALRRRLTTMRDVEAALPELGRTRVPGVRRIRRVLARRPAGAPATESLLETLMVQLARTVDGLPDPVRQHGVLDAAGALVTRVDLCWPVGLFVELDGQHHEDQPVHDARRETAVVAATGWLVGRFTWHEVVRVPRTTARRLGDLAAQARGRHQPAVVSRGTGPRACRAG